MFGPPVAALSFPRERVVYCPRCGDRTQIFLANAELAREIAKRCTSCSQFGLDLFTPDDRQPFMLAGLGL